MSASRKKAQEYDAFPDNLARSNIFCNLFWDSFISNFQSLDRTDPLSWSNLQTGLLLNPYKKIIRVISSLSSPAVYTQGYCHQTKYTALRGVYTSNFFHDLELYLDQILSLYVAKSLGQSLGLIFCFLEGRFLAQIKDQIVDRIGCADAASRSQFLLLLAEECLDLVWM